MSKDPERLYYPSFKRLKNCLPIHLPRWKACPRFMGISSPKGQDWSRLNANAIMDENHLMPYVDELRKLLAEANVPMSETNIVVTGGRVRAGYRIGLLFDSDPRTFRGILHVIGERPQNHASLLFRLHNGRQGRHMGEEKNRSRYHQTRMQYCRHGPGPREAARETITIIREMVGRKVNNSRLLGRS